MAWTEATQVNYRRAHDHRQNDVSDRSGLSIPEQGRMNQYMLAALPPFSTVQNYFYAARCGSRRGVCRAAWFR